MPSERHARRLGHDAPVDPLGQVGLADGGAEEQLARLEVVDDVHHLEHHAGDAAVAGRLGRAGGQQEEVAQVGRLGHRRRHPVAEGRAQVLDRLGQHRPQRAARRADRSRSKRLSRRKASTSPRPREVEPPPVDDRAAAQQEPQRLQLGHPHRLRAAGTGRAPLTGFGSWLTGPISCPVQNWNGKVTGWPLGSPTRGKRMPRTTPIMHLANSPWAYSGVRQRTSLGDAVGLDDPGHLDRPLHAGLAGLLLGDAAAQGRRSGASPTP